MCLNLLSEVEMIFKGTGVTKSDVEMIFEGTGVTNSEVLIDLSLPLA